MTPMKFILFTVLFSFAAILAPDGAVAAGNKRKPAAATGAQDLPPRPRRLAADQRLGKLRWEFDLGSRHNITAPVLGEKNLFVGDTKSALFAVDIASGALKWKRKMYPTGLAYAKGVVYMVDDKGYIRALDAASGATRWEFSTGGGGFGAPIVKDGFVYGISRHYNRKSSIWTSYLWLLNIQGEEEGRFVKEEANIGPRFIVGDDMVFVTVTRHMEGTIVGVDKVSGEPRWRPSRLDGGSLSLYARDRLLVNSDNSFIALAPAKSGTVLWRHDTGSGWHGRPATSGGLVFAPFFERRSRRVWAAYMVARDLASGKERWRLEMGNWKRRTSPSASNGVVCVGTSDRYLHGIDIKQGKTKWVFAPPKKVKRPFVGALDCKVSGDTVLAWDSRGSLFVLERETGKLRWASALPRGVKSLTLRGDTVYAIASGGVLYALH